MTAWDMRDRTFSTPALEAMPAAQAARKEIQRQERRGDQPSLKRILTAVGVDRAHGEVWIALNNTLLAFRQGGETGAPVTKSTRHKARVLKPPPFSSSRTVC